MSQAFEAIQKIDIPDDCEEFHSELLENFKSLSIDEIKVLVDEKSCENKAYGTALDKIMKSLKPSTTKTKEAKGVQDTILYQ
jgi:hypothetical protein